MRDIIELFNVEDVLLTEWFCHPQSVELCPFDLINLERVCVPRREDLRRLDRLTLHRHLALLYFVLPFK